MYLFTPRYNGQVNNMNPTFDLQLWNNTFYSPSQITNTSSPMPLAYGYYHPYHPYMTNVPSFSFQPTSVQESSPQIQPPSTNVSNSSTQSEQDNDRSLFDRSRSSSLLANIIREFGSPVHVNSSRDMSRPEISAQQFLQRTQLVPYYYIYSREERRDEENENNSNEESNEQEQEQELHDDEEEDEHDNDEDDDPPYSNDYIASNLHVSYQVNQILNNSCFCNHSFRDHSVVCVLPCNHGFHYRCIANWFFCDHARQNNFQNTCPFCRQPL